MSLLRSLIDHSLAYEAPSAAVDDNTYDSLETLKLLVRSRFGSEIGFGITAAAISQDLCANDQSVNDALASCEDDGDAWVLFSEDSTGEAYWSGDPAHCDAAVPHEYAGGNAGVAATPSQPPAKKAKISSSLAPAVTHVAAQSCQSSGDAFEDLKIVLHARVAAEGAKGVTSGKLGYDLGCDRKAITAALYGCQKDGTVNNVAAEGPPRWVSLIQPAPGASSMAVPAKYGYKGSKADGQQGAQHAAAVQPKAATAVKVMKAPVVSNIENPIPLINEWAQKNKHSLQFTDLGSGAGGFLCRVSVDGKEVAVQSARNKKEAKANAAAAAVQALGLV